MSTFHERFSYYANAYGQCDSCNGAENVPVVREDNEQGWQECERCYKARLDRRMARAQARKGAA